MPSTPLRTIVYVDGFNLYYRCLKHTAFKWLDLDRLARNLLPADRHSIVGIKYFTARVQDCYGNGAASRQDIYMQALQRHCPNLRIIEGKFLTNTQKRPLAPPGTGFAEIIHTEEKGTDVNIAVHLLNDAWLDAYDCAALISNDSDLTEALRLAKARGKGIGWLVPGDRHVSKSLMNVATFFKIIRNKNLSLSQLPDTIPGTTIHKPAGW